jgi:hypothetical protein
MDWWVVICKGHGMALCGYVTHILVCILITGQQKVAATVILKLGYAV